LVKYVYSEKYGVDFHGHVFPVEKYRLIYASLVKLGLVDSSRLCEPEMPSSEDLLLVLEPEYLEDLSSLRCTPATIRSELALTSDIVEFAKLMVGGTILACKKALEFGIGFHIGGGFHHAFPDHAEGFCYINDIAVAIRKLQKEGSVKRFAVIDCDLHQGNGTAYTFANDPDVFTFSIHQENLYPIKQTSDMDIGLGDFAGDEEYVEKLGQSIPRIMDDRKPELMVYVAGADPYKDDMLGTLQLSKEGLKARDRIVIEPARARGIPVGVVLAGGYAANTVDTVAIHLNTCLVCEDAEKK
jgi:acetoin utilization deacetylase AcuC-like enzyme